MTFHSITIDILLQAPLLLHEGILEDLPRHRVEDKGALELIRIRREFKDPADLGRVGAVLSARDEYEIFEKGEETCSLMRHVTEKASDHYYRC